MNLANIKSIVKSAAWADIVQLIKEERDTLPVINKDKTKEEIGTDIIAYEIAKDKINHILFKINSIADEKEANKTSYK